MSKVALSGNASGTGTFTIASPNSNTDRTLSLPDATGTVQVSGNPISGTTGTFSGAVSGTTGTFTSGVSVGPSVTFGDATVQTTAAVAPTTATVLAATAGASVGAVGTYAYMRFLAGTSINPGSTIAGSSLLYGGGAYIPCSGASWYGVTTPSGTWRAMGYANRNCISVGATVFLRIS
jgi:hypothetical protein